MSALAPTWRPARVPVRWVPSHPGTNGYVSTWGAILAGVVPVPADA
ncbi:hypothetical protein ABT336_20745 [Micromonospora sp. NPDC000207]